MTTGTRGTAPLTGTVGLVSGVLALAGVGWIALLTFSSLDVAEGLRIAGSWLLPLGAAAAVGAAVLARPGRDRSRALVGLALAGVAVLGLVAMLVAVDA
ncbi:hypothetical protein [Actinotalea sp. Marseille-Q4924]|uniref:hypothetical protein n=1 Tax=Actinotalea sp. Marseille-Q4924 TaxID=2866571 RepID=UPI001CE4AFDE|nr:hypothetical protein [Actinotalea sp. Marseille-Q4924]